MFPEELKETTADAHMALERKMIPHLKNITSIADYTKLLSFLHVYYAELDDRLTPYVEAGLYHSHSENIRRDLQHLNGHQTFTWTHIPQMPEIDSTEKALGVLYVLEGSTLGGQVITTMLLKQLNSPDSTGFSFYNPYGEETMARWQKFKARLNGPFTDKQKQAIIDGANATFSSLNRWISSYEQYTSQ
jgi:heme oxygenase